MSESNEHFKTSRLINRRKYTHSSLCKNLKEIYRNDFFVLFFIYTFLIVCTFDSVDCDKAGKLNLNIPLNIQNFFSIQLKTNQNRIDSKNSRA
jgi:hypothetical protein